MPLPPNLRPSAEPPSDQPPPLTTELRYTISVGGEARSFFVEANGLLSPEQLLPYLQAEISRLLLSEEAYRLESQALQQDQENRICSPGDQSSLEV